MINEQQKEYFDAMEETMATKGWALFIKDLQGNQEAIKSSLMVQADLEKFFIAKGRYLTLTDIIGLETFLESAKTNLEEQEAEDNAVV